MLPPRQRQRVMFPETLLDWPAPHSQAVVTNARRWPLTDRPFHGAVMSPRNSYPLGTCFASVSPKISHVVSSGRKKLLFMRSGSDYPHRFTESKGCQYSGYRPYQQNHKKRIYAHNLTSYAGFTLFSESPRNLRVSIFQMTFHPKRYPSTDGRFCQYRADRSASPVCNRLARPVFS